MDSAQRVAARFLASEYPPGTKIKVKPTHGVPAWHHDEGTIEKYVPFGKYYVQLKGHGRQLVDQSDLEKTASTVTAEGPDHARLERIVSSLEHEVKDIRSALDKYKQDPAKYKPQLSNIEHGASIIGSDVRVLLRTLGKE